MKATKRAKPGTINNALGAIDDFYVRRGLGKVNAKREDATRRTAPKSLSETNARQMICRSCALSAAGGAPTSVPPIGTLRTRQSCRRDVVATRPHPSTRRRDRDLCSLSLSRRSCRWLQAWWS